MFIIKINMFRIERPVVGTRAKNNSLQTVIKKNIIITVVI